MSNLKKILCKNIIINKFCKYDNKCLYAHSLEEQNINCSRKYAYDIIKSTNDLSDIDLNEDINLYTSLVQLSVYCHNCVNNTCTGGYNCKYGACKYEYIVCLTDLNFNNCTDTTCKKIHLSKRNLRPIKLINCDNELNINIRKFIYNYDSDTTISDIVEESDSIVNNDLLVSRSIFE